MKHLFLLLAAASLVFGGCRKKPLDPVPDIDTVSSTGKLRLSFRNVVGSQNLVLNTQTYATAAGDSFTVSTFKYFISNIELVDASGTAMKPAPTYNLINQAGNRVASGSGFTPGTYTKVRFLIGVDSARNVSGAQEGDLDPAGAAAGMFWDWNTGYIMAMMEGSSPLSPVANNRLMFHMGGFQGRHSVLRTVALDLPSPVIIGKGKTTELHINADLRQWFSSPIDIRFAATPVAMDGADAAQIADNYMDMFTVTEVHNEE